MVKKEELTKHQKLENYFIEKLYSVIDEIIDKSKYKSPSDQAKHIMPMLTNLQKEYEDVMITKRRLPASLVDNVNRC